MDENVPIIVPKSIARVNPLIESGPKRSIATRTNTRVREVYILRVNDSESEVVTISRRFFPFPQYTRRLERIRSNITMVSLIEYPSIVRSAVTKKVSI